MALGFGFGFGRLKGKPDSSGSIPSAPIIAWASAADINPPLFDIALDNTRIWPAAQIDANNLDRVEVQTDTDSLFGSPDNATHDLSASEIEALEFDMNIGAQPAFILLYARARHIHYVNGHAFTSAWSNVVTQTLTTSPDQLPYFTIIFN